MAEVRCPMCSRPNHESAEECGFCGARLKPLIVDDDPTEQPLGDQPQSTGPDEEEGVPGWLSRIRERAEEEIGPEEPAEDESDTDWLSRLRSVETDDSGPPEDLPQWLEEGADIPEDDQDEDWLGRLRQSTTPESEEPEMVEDSAMGLEASAGLSDEPTDPDFDPEQQLRGLLEEGPGLSESSQISDEEQAEDESISPDWAREEPGEVDSDSTEEEFPSFFEEEGEDEPELEIPGESEPAGDALETGVPDWFDEFEQAAADEEIESEPTSEVDEFDAQEFASFEADELPDWLEDEEAEAIDRLEPAPTEAADSAPIESTSASPLDEEQPDVDWQEFDWEALGEDEELQEQPLPEGLGAPPEALEEDLPHVPALIIGEEDGAIISPGSDEFDLDAIELPDWLSEVEQELPAEQTTDRSGDLAPATIPNWLEAMRPVETFRPVVDIEPEEERAVESVGPLAGLRGVLLAEPVVAKPRSTTSVGDRLQVTERQYAQADILRRIVEQEDQERVGARDAPRGLPIVRWLISFVLVAAVLLPSIFGLPNFATPARVSRDLGPLLEVVNGVQSGQPALVVFDYEPGYSAELEAVASTMLHNLMSRDVHVVTLSTRPTGPPLALDLINEVGQPHQIENGRDYIHLGYLSGGPTAVQLFSIAPKEAILKGFMLPADLDLQSGWDAPVLRNVNRLSDFGMVAVITAGTDNARIWAEQAHPWLGETPMVMVLSAGAEPMVRPYFESLDPRVDGILTGLPAAVAYEQINDRPGQAQGRWDAFGSGVLAVEVILAIGLVYGMVSWIIDRRREAESQ